MKKDNWLHYKISRSPDYVLLGAVLIICLLYRFFYFGFLHPGMVLYHSDSVAYFAFVDIFRGIVDLYHTPVYPYVIRFFEYVSKDNLVQNLIFFQQTISFLSIIPFYFVSKNIAKNKYLIVIASLFYGLWHPILIQNVNLSPESLCFAGSTLLLFIFVKYLEKPGKLTAAFLGLLPFLLIMLKPTYLILIFLVLFFMVLRFVLLREERKILYWGLLGLIISSAGILGYCEMNKRHNGQFVLSNISLNNTLAHISQSGAYRDGGDDEFIAIIDATRHMGYYTAPFMINNDVIDKYYDYIKRFPSYLPPTDDMLYCMTIPNTANYSPDRIEKFVKNSVCTTVYFKYMFYRAAHIIIAYGYLFILLASQSAIIIGVFVKYKKIAWVQGFLILFVLGQFFSITIGGLDDIDRCLNPAYPFIILIAASFSAFLISFLKKEKYVEIIL
jgi:hypothetical protein